MKIPQKISPKFCLGRFWVPREKKQTDSPTWPPDLKKKKKKNNNKILGIVNSPRVRQLRKRCIIRFTCYSLIFKKHKTKRWNQSISWAIVKHSFSFQSVDIGFNKRPFLNLKLFALSFLFCFCFLNLIYLV
jgi:hypothetical protein